MIGITLFRIFAGISSAIFLFYTLSYLVTKFVSKQKVIQILDYWGLVVKNLLFIISTAALIVTILFCSVFPYVAQENDKMLISEYKDNITLYQRYSEEYATGARKQIAEYQKMQSEMARTATLVQLQFFSQQQDSIGNALTNEIRRFQVLIMDQELAINKANSRILRRPFNKWYFGIDK